MSANILVSTIGLTVYIIASAFMNTYIFSKAKKTLLLAFYTAAVLNMMFWSIVKLLEMVSPTMDIRKSYITVQYVFAPLLVAALFCFLALMYYKNAICKAALAISLCTLVLIVILIWICFLIEFVWWSGLMLTVVFLCINITVFFYRYKAFPEMAVSLDGIVDNVDDGVVVFDSSGTLVDTNDLAMEQAFVCSEVQSVNDFVQQINSYLKRDLLELEKVISLENNNYEKEICIEAAGNTKYYNFHASILKNKKGVKIGTICTLRDITQNKLISIELEKKNIQIQSLNSELEAYIRIAGSLAEEKEQARIAREINGTIGQKLTEILSVLEVVKLKGIEDVRALEKPLNDAIERCREVLGEVRMVVSRLIPDKHKEGK